jgi:two-component system, cell cycle sensor histidine kinase and response regulator CckA
MDSLQEWSGAFLAPTSKKSIKRVLLVEDNPGDAGLIREMLSQPGGQNTRFTHVECIADAERCIAGQAVDVLLLDLGLPDAQGIEAVRRAQAFAPRIPLVVLSGMDDELLTRQALQEGAQDYLIKGHIEPDGLMRALRYAIERKTIEESLFAEKERAQVTLDCIGDAVICTDLAGKITFLNLVAESMTGWSLKEAIGKIAVEAFCIVDATSRTAVLNPMQRVRGRALDTKSRSDCILIRRDGLEITVEDCVARIHNREGQVIGAVSVLRDVTADRRLKDELRQGQKMEVIGRLAGGVAHDFNNILTGIIGFSELLMEELEEGTKMFSKASEIKKAGERAAALTGQLLSFSRRQQLQPRLISLNTVVLELREMLSRLIGDQIELRNELDQSLGTICADPGQMSQVILNLALNARDAMPHGGRLTIQTSNSHAAQGGKPIRGLEPGDYVSLTVTDSGWGMDQETQEHMFEPFYTTKPQGSGTGLGLATVFGIVNQAGGKINCSSEVGVGTSFWIDFPDVAGVSVPELPKKRLEVARASETVLLVEDDEMIRDLIVTVLAAQGYKVLVASQADEALDLCRSDQLQIDILLTDLLMPGRLDGRELAEEATATRVNMKVLLMSGYTKETLTLRGVENNMEFLQKPFTPQQLLCKVRDALSRDMGDGRLVG